ncbi:SPV084 mutT motif gene expression regulator [Swinepox virus]|uniref:SPV084 mutT motif gene expression regulator n=1 Tax=Swinepox virus (strain Swine/Nebraska/17077-99/1999) TaxID=300880 RepID=Q8V3L1_SWPV1|nr:SPV084 mutT motif gene expression regulator [Swinepox virus]AAL69823.1 SPV084 mutT motif gene expression regulator [Swinepox virus]UED36612.1 SPV084 mutT motif gene expression regulator [Swinepox virus]UED36761.1 SPV084 mutT motif gene expression regulator [Swinepox virus]UUA44274.1 SPV084 [Swinepox virus]
MTEIFHSKNFSYINNNNTKLTKTYIWSDDIQRIRATGFIYQCLLYINRISICALILTSDNKYIACYRKHSFLYTEIIRSRNVFRKKRLFMKYAKYLRKKERQYLLNELNIDNSLTNETNDHRNIIFPGGQPKIGEDFFLCLAREIKEEINIDTKNISIDYRFFIHMFIDDLLIDRVYETILFLGKTDLSSDDILNNFLSNREITSIVFLDTFDEGIHGDIIRFVLSVSKLKCLEKKENNIQL